MFKHRNIDEMMREEAQFDNSPEPTYEEIRESVKGSAAKSTRQISEYWHDFITKGKLPSYEWVFNNIFEEVKDDEFWFLNHSISQSINTFDPDYLDNSFCKPCIELDIFQFYSEEFIEPYRIYKEIGC